MKENQNIFFAGQITGVEGYVESISSGLVAGINATVLAYIYQMEEDSNNEVNIDNKKILEQYNKKKITFPKETMIGALSKYISTENDKFQPMNANFGIVPELKEKIKDKKERYKMLSNTAIQIIKKVVEEKNV